MLLWGFKQKFKLMVQRPNLAVDVLVSSQNVGLQNVFKGFQMVANLEVRSCHIKIPNSGFCKKKTKKNPEYLAHVSPKKQ